MRTAELTSPMIVRFDDLAPTWDTPRAREPGFLRWLVSYVGGVPPFWSNNPETVGRARAFRDRDLRDASGSCRVDRTRWPPAGRRPARLPRDATGCAPGALVIPPGNSEVPHAYPTPRHYLVVSGRGAVVGDQGVAPFEPLDVVVLPPDVPQAVRAVGTESLRLISLHEIVQPEGSGKYVEVR